MVEFTYRNNCIILATTREAMELSLAAHENGLETIWVGVRVFVNNNDLPKIIEILEGVVESIMTKSLETWKKLNNCVLYCQDVQTTTNILQTAFDDFVISNNGNFIKIDDRGVYYFIDLNETGSSVVGVQPTISLGRHIYKVVCDENGTLSLK